MKFKIYFIALMAVVFFFSECKKKKDPVPENVVPTVSITSPLNHDTVSVSSSITINVTAGDVDGTISKVDFYSGSTLIGTDVSSPYSYTLMNVPAGIYTLTAKATDNTGGVSTSSAITVMAVYSDVCAGNSANTTYIPLAVGNEWTYDGFITATSAIPKDTIAGGNTYYKAIITPTNPFLPTTYQRYKTNGDLVGLNPDTLAVGKLYEEKLIPANPQVNDTWTDANGAIYTVTSITASQTTTACTYSGLLAIRVVTSSGTMFYYYKKGVGLVYLECSSGLTCTFFTSPEYLKSMKIQ